MHPNHREAHPVRSAGVYAILRAASRKVTSRAGLPLRVDATLNSSQRQTSQQPLRAEGLAPDSTATLIFSGDHTPAPADLSLQADSSIKYYLVPVLMIQYLKGVFILTRCRQNGRGRRAALADQSCALRQLPGGWKRGCLSAVAHPGPAQHDCRWRFTLRNEPEQLQSFPQRSR
jgi:hypothetical protein